MCKLLFKGVKLINCVPVYHIYATPTFSFFVKLFNDIAQEKKAKKIAFSLSKSCLVEKRKAGSINHLHSKLEM